ncbi:MAG: glycosyltransferase [Pyrinomonadaceae bacterium]|nr:glycosyltransferase [Pyrinomonadaceae bacterium]
MTKALSQQVSDNKNKGRVLYVGNCYYHNWYLSRELRKLGWVADTLDTDSNEEWQMYYHGQDFKFRYGGIKNALSNLLFYFKALRRYDIFHFYGVHGLTMLPQFSNRFSWLLPKNWDARLLKKLNKKIVYGLTGCLDGVSQSSFAAWGDEPICNMCRWRDVPSVCSDERNLAWGKIRNELADYIILGGGNRVDYNDVPHAHEVPELGCLDPNIWSPDILIPANYRLPFSEDTIKIYHSVGHFESRTDVMERQNIKSTHIIIPVVERLKAEGYKVELIFFHDVPNIKVRYYQAQADIVVDMLTYGFFGANVREALMLGKPSVCYLRPEWLESMRAEVPDYVDELPVISATPQTVYEVLKDLIEHPEKRLEIGRRSREFAVKWHSAEAAARRFDKIYTELLQPGASHSSERSLSAAKEVRLES